MRGSKRHELQQLFAANRRLFKAYVLREQLDRLWTYRTREGVAGFLFGWLKALRWQRLPEMEMHADTLVNHFDGIAAYCDHPVRFGVVESLNTTIKGVLRRARGLRDEKMLLLKLKWERPTDPIIPRSRKVPSGDSSCFVMHTKRRRSETPRDSEQDGWQVYGRHRGDGAF